MSYTAVSGPILLTVDVNGDGVVSIPVVGRVQIAGNNLITVTVTGDGISDDGLCSLREAIIAANTGIAANGCPAGTGSDTIVFDPSVQPAGARLDRLGAGEDRRIDGRPGCEAIVGDRRAGAGETVPQWRRRQPQRRSGVGDTAWRGRRHFGRCHPARLDWECDPHRRRRADRFGRNADADRVTDRTELRYDRRGHFRLRHFTSHRQQDHAPNYGDAISLTGGWLDLRNSEIQGIMDGYGIRASAWSVIDMTGGFMSGNAFGGIFAVDSDVTISQSVIQYSAGTGGIRVEGPTHSMLSVDTTEIKNNQATSGAGITNVGIGATAVISDSVLRDNSAASAGGAIYNTGSLTLVRSLIASNTARTGGGIDHSGGTLHVLNSTLDGNTALDGGRRAL